MAPTTATPPAPLASERGSGAAGGRASSVPLGRNPWGSTRYSGLPPKAGRGCRTPTRPLSAAGAAALLLLGDTFTGGGARGTEGAEERPQSGKEDVRESASIYTGIPDWLARPQTRKPPSLSHSPCNLYSKKTAPTPHSACAEITGTDFGSCRRTRGPPFSTARQPLCGRARPERPFHPARGTKSTYNVAGRPIPLGGGARFGRGRGKIKTDPLPSMLSLL